MQYILLISFFISPVFAYAHTDISRDDTSDKTPQAYMQILEDRALGDELHLEMEDLMTKMMNGELDDNGITRLEEFMASYPGPQAMMTNRLMLDNTNTFGGFGMMRGGYGMGTSFWFWIVLLQIAAVAWTLVGVLLLAWLWKKITKKD